MLPVSALAHVCGDHDLIVMPVTPPTVNRDLQALIVKDGVPAVITHGLRHGAATIMLRAGVFPALGAQNPGHADLGATGDRHGTWP